MSKKISICIPMIRDFPSIYSTINNIQTEMFDSKYDWEIIVCENGEVDSNTPKAFTGNRALYRNIMPSEEDENRRVLLQYTFEKFQCGPVARNTAARLADGDYVIFMDSHTTPAKNSIDILADFLEEHPECGCISGLTAWSHYSFHRMGAYYELFHLTKDKMKTRGPSLPTHMHGHYMGPGHTELESENRDNLFKGIPVRAVMGSQAYTMYRREEFWDLGGYFGECRLYPHPEGYMPLKVWMSGKEVYIHPQSWHIHGMYPRQYNITQEKIQKYGGLSLQEHSSRNVLMIAYILGGHRWMDICRDALTYKYGYKEETMDRLVKSAHITAQPERDRLKDKFIYLLDDILIKARKEGILGMEKWYTPVLGDDPLT